MSDRIEEFFTVRKGSIHDSVLQVLLQSKKPMKVSEITKKVLKIKKINSKTTSNTISSILQRSTFVKTGSDHGYYTIIKKPIFRK